jgi:hypothetical protein
MRHTTAPQNALDSRSRVRWTALTATLVVALAAHALAQDGVVARYPEPAKVAADYADDAERYAALKVLYDDLGAKTTGGHVPGAYAKSSAYFAAFQSVTAKYMNLKKDAPESVAYSDHVSRLFKDAAFRRAVIEKYGLADLPDARPATQPGVAAQPAPGSGDVTDSMIQAACLRALPFVLASLAAATLACRALLPNSVGYPSGRSEPMPPPPGVPAMPESLRVVSLPGVEYCVETSCGIVIEKETTIATTVHTTTTGGQAYAVGNEVHFTPSQTQTTASSVRTDLIWVRTPEGREESWSFTGGTFKARTGQIITLITRTLPDGSSERLFVYNHATGQLEWCDGIGHANAVSHTAAWWSAFAISSVGMAIAVEILLSIGPDPIQGLIGWVAAWIVGAIPAVIAAFVVEGVVHRGVARRRNAPFVDRYVPGFREYLEQITPALQKRLGGA